MITLSAGSDRHAAVGTWVPDGGGKGQKPLDVNELRRGILPTVLQYTFVRRIFLHHLLRKGPTIGAKSTRLLL